MHGICAHFDDLDLDARSQWLGRGENFTLNHFSKSSQAPQWGTAD